MAESVKVLVVGQTPPPHHGQSIMIEALLAGTFEQIELTHVRMSFSATIDDVGRARVGKLWHLAKVIGNIWAARIRHRPDVLYYPPSGPTRTPVRRDMAVLLATRWAFPRTVFHFHAGGLSEIEDSLSRPERVLFRRAFGRPDVAITLSELSPLDGECLGARQTRIIPNGIDDHVNRFPALAAERNGVLRILFVGAVRGSKGVQVMLDALLLLRDRGVTFLAQFVGSFASASAEHDFRSFVGNVGFDEQVVFTGSLTGDDKWQIYAEADVFCFPSFYESESFPVVLLEAMQFGLPVVSTRWRGIPSIVDDGVTGCLVPIGDVGAVADRLEMLARDPELRAAMGAAARHRYLASYTVERWHRRMEDVLLEAAGQPSVE